MQDDFQRLQVSRSIENGPIESELPNESTAPAITESLSPLDLFIRDLDERKGKLPCCQEVTDIQTSVEKFVKALLLGVEKKLPFYKTTLVNSGSFYEGTKVGKPDEFDYFVQLDNFSRPKDILYEELAHCMVIVIPSEAAFKKFRKFNPDSFHDFKWKREVKSPFVEAFSCFLATGFKAFGLKILSHMLNRHGPAYTLELEWNGGEIYKALKIKIDLSLAVKINSHSSTMAVDFESGAGKVVKSLLHTMPYYFAISGYRMYRLSPSKFFKEHKPGVPEDFSIMKEKRGKFPPLVITCQPNNCCLRCSQSCLEQSLFRDHFGPDGGQSVCLRVLKVLRDMTLPYDEDTYFRNLNPFKYNFDKRERECIDKYVSKFFNDDEIPVSDSNIDLNEYSSTKWISSYTLKTLVLFEWSKNPEDKQWTGSNLTQRLVNILHNLLSALKKNKGIRSFWYKDYNVLPREAEAFLPDAINRVTIIRNCISSLGNARTYCFENCVQTVTNILTMARQKRKLADFLHTGLRKIFWDKVREVLEESVCKKKKETLDMIELVDFVNDPDVFSDIYLQALLDKIAPEEDLILTCYYECKKEKIFAWGTDSFTQEEAEEIVKNAREIFEEIAHKKMSHLDNLPDYSLWSQEFTTDEVTNMLKFLCENFEKDLEILRKKLKTEKESRTPGTEPCK